jgi:hypothetical protein
MTACATHGAHICSLCLSTDRVGDHVLPAQVPHVPDGSARTRSLDPTA